MEVHIRDVAVTAHWESSITAARFETIADEFE
jgi:hypothetical protein